MVKNQTENIIHIKTPHGIRNINKKDIIHFPEGLLGFDKFTDFVIFDIKGCEPFKSMLSVEEDGPDFVVVDSISIFKDYSPMDSFSSLEELGIGTPVELVVLSIVTLSENPEDITVNLRGPLFINLANRLAKQAVLPDERYSTRIPLLIEE